MVLVSYILCNHVSLLQTQLGDRERHEASRMRPSARPLDAHMEGGHGKRQPRLHIRPHPVQDLLAVADARQPGKSGLHPQARLPLPPLTPCEVARSARRGLAAGITPAHPALLTRPPQPWQGVIRHMGGLTRPRPHHALLGQPQAEGAADQPALLRPALATALLRAAACAPRVAAREAVGGDAAEPRRSGPEALRPVLRRPAEATEPRPVGEAGAQGARGARPPARAGTIPAPCAGMEPPQGDDRTGPEGGLSGGGGRSCRCASTW
jgi:hypothetical protein